MVKITTYTPTRWLDARSGARVPRERQYPDWRIARRHSGEWRSRETSVSLVPKMPHAAEHHGHAQLVGRRDDVRIANRSAGLNYGGGTGLSRFLQTIGERKECVRSDDASGQRELRLHNRNFH